MRARIFRRKSCALQRFPTTGVRKLPEGGIDEAIAEATCVTKRVSLEAAPEEGEEDFFA
jgi:hypothetical protein